MRAMYAAIQLTPPLEDGWRYTIIPQEHSSGAKLVHHAPDGTERLSTSSQAPILSLGECRAPHNFRPVQADGREVFTAVQIVVFGGAREWWVGSNTPSDRFRLAAADALWMSSPMELRADVMDNIAEVEHVMAIHPADHVDTRRSSVNGDALPPHLAKYPELLEPTSRTVCEHDGHFEEKLDYARITAKVDFLLSRLAEGAGKSYKAVWQHFCLRRSIQKKD